MWSDISLVDAVALGLVLSEGIEGSLVYLDEMSKMSSAAK